MLTGLSHTPRLDVELLMADALEVSRSDLLVKHDDTVVPAKFADHFRRRLAQEPVAYIIGCQEFYGRTFTVTPHVLIPRGDSETLIEAALELAPDAARMLDLGTGSGALLLTLLAEKPPASGVALDASEAALEVAMLNADLLQIGQDRVRFEPGDWTRSGWTDHLGTFDLILCNPPYVEDDAELDPDVRDYEPAEALFAGKDGLDDYRVIIPQLGKLLNEGGIAILEIGHTQGEAVTKLAENAGFAVETRNDLANRPRCVVLR